MNRDNASYVRPKEQRHRKQYHQNHLSTLCTNFQIHLKDALQNRIAIVKGIAVYDTTYCHSIYCLSCGNKVISLLINSKCRFKSNLCHCCPREAFLCDFKCPPSSIKG